MLSTVDLRLDLKGARQEAREQLITQERERERFQLVAEHCCEKWCSNAVPRGEHTRVGLHDQEALHVSSGNVPETRRLLVARDLGEDRSKEFKRSEDEGA